MLAVGIDTGRHLMVTGGSSAAVIADWTAGKTLADDARAAALVRELGSPVSAYLAFGTSACSDPTRGQPESPQAVAEYRALLAKVVGTLTAFDAAAVGVSGGTHLSATGAAHFAHASDARSNEKARTAAVPLVEKLQDATADAFSVRSSAVHGAVLVLALTQQRPSFLQHAVSQEGLGFDVCPPSQLSPA